MTINYEEKKKIISLAFDYANALAGLVATTRQGIITEPTGQVNQARESLLNYLDEITDT